MDEFLITSRKFHHYQRKQLVMWQGRHCSNCQSSKASNWFNYILFRLCVIGPPSTVWCPGTDWGHQAWWQAPSLQSTVSSSTGKLYIDLPFLSSLWEINQNSIKKWTPKKQTWFLGQNLHSLNWKLLQKKDNMAGLGLWPFGLGSLDWRGPSHYDRADKSATLCLCWTLSVGSLGVCYELAEGIYIINPQWHFGV